MEDEVYTHCQNSHTWLAFLKNPPSATGFPAGYGARILPQKVHLCPTGTRTSARRSVQCIKNSNKLSIGS